MLNIRKTIEAVCAVAQNDTHNCVALLFRSAKKLSKGT